MKRSLLLALPLLLLPGLVFADAGGAPPALDPSLLELAFRGIAEGNWFLVAGPALTLVTLAVRWLLANRWPALATSDRWGVAITAVLAGAGALGHAWLAGSPVADATTALGAVKVFVMAVATYVVTRRLVGAGGTYLKIYAEEGESAADIAARIAAEMDRPKDGQPPTAPNNGAIGLVSFVLLVAGFGCIVASCSLGKRAAEHGGSLAANVVDCTSKAATDAVSTTTPALAAVIRAATSPDGHVDWTPIGDASKGLTTAAKQCALAAAVKEALTIGAALVGAPQSSPAELDQNSLRAGWESQRAAWGGAQYKLTGGAL